jgi:hypothetical protein
MTDFENDGLGWFANHFGPCEHGQVRGYCGVCGPAARQAPGSGQREDTSERLQRTIEAHEKTIAANDERIKALAATNARLQRIAREERPPPRRPGLFRRRRES